MGDTKIPTEENSSNEKPLAKDNLETTAKKTSSNITSGVNSSSHSETKKKDLNKSKDTPVFSTTNNASSAANNAKPSATASTSKAKQTQVAAPAKPVSGTSQQAVTTPAKTNTASTSNATSKVDSNKPEASDTAKASDNAKASDMPKTKQTQVAAAKSVTGTSGPEVTTPAKTTTVSTSNTKSSEVPDKAKASDIPKTNQTQVTAAAKSVTGTSHQAVTTPAKTTTVSTSNTKPSEASDNAKASDIPKTNQTQGTAAAKSVSDTSRPEVTTPAKTTTVSTSNTKPSEASDNAKASEMPNKTQTQGTAAAKPVSDPSGPEVATPAKTTTVSTSNTKPSEVSDNAKASDIPKTNQTQVATAKSVSDTSGPEVATPEKTSTVSTSNTKPSEASDNVKASEMPNKTQTQVTAAAKPVSETSQDQVTTSGTINTASSTARTPMKAKDLEGVMVKSDDTSHSSVVRPTVTNPGANQMMSNDTLDDLIKKKDTSNNFATKPHQSATTPLSKNSNPQDAGFFNLAATEDLDSTTENVFSSLSNDQTTKSFDDLSSIKSTDDSAVTDTLQQAVTMADTPAAPVQEKPIQSARATKTTAPTNLSDMPVAKKPARQFEGPYIDLQIKKIKIKGKLLSLTPLKNTTILSDIKLALPRGRKLLIIGENGAGKSTLLRTLMGFNHVSGDLKIKGLNPFSSQTEVLKELAYASDHYHLPPDYEVEELLELISFFNPNFILPQAKLFLEKTQLNYANKLTHQLSKGMETMLRNALALATNVDIALFDEPTLGVDPVQKLTFINELSAKAKANPNFTYVITTHTPSDVLSVVDDVMFMFRGTISPKIPIARIDRLFVGNITKQIRRNSNAIGVMMKPEINAIKQIFWKTQAPPEANQPVTIEELYSVISNNASMMGTMKIELDQIGNL